MIDTTKWLVNLESGKRIVAILLIAVATLWSSSKYYEHKYSSDLTGRDNKIQTLNQLLLSRADSFDLQRAKDLDDCKTQYEDFLKNQLMKIQNSAKENAKLIQNNAKLINKK